MKAYRYRRNDERKEAGFTLLEVIFSITILAIGLLAMADMHVMAINTNAKARRITESTAQVQAVIEEFMKVPLDSPLMNDSTSISEDDIPETLKEQRNDMKKQGYDLAWSVSQPSTDSKLITVTVSWTEMGFLGGLFKKITKKTRLSYLTVKDVVDDR